MTTLSLIQRIKQAETTARNEAYLAEKKLYLIGQVKVRISNCDATPLRMSLATDGLGYMHTAKELDDLAETLGLRITAEKKQEVLANGDAKYDLTFGFTE